MISENNMALLKQKCIDIAKSFYENWAAVGKAVDKMLVDANVPTMRYKAAKFGLQPKVNEYDVKYNSHGYDFTFVWNNNAPNGFVLKVSWNSLWSYVSHVDGPAYWVLGIDSGYTLEAGVKLLVERLAETKGQSLIEWKEVHDSRIFENFAKGAVGATNNLIRLITDAYNKALDLESKNDNILLSAFELNADGPAHVKPKQYDIKIVERKTECASTQKQSTTAITA